MRRTSISSGKSIDSRKIKLNWIIKCTSYINQKYWFNLNCFWDRKEKKKINCFENRTRKSNYNDILGHVWMDAVIRGLLAVLICEIENEKQIYVQRQIEIDACNIWIGMAFKICSRLRLFTVLYLPWSICIGGLLFRSHPCETFRIAAAKERCGPTTKMEIFNFIFTLNDAFIVGARISKSYGITNLCGRMFYAKKKCKWLHTLDICEMVHSRLDFHPMDDDARHTHSEMIADCHGLTNTQKIHHVLAAQLYSTVVPISNTKRNSKRNNDRAALYNVVNKSARIMHVHP